MLSTLARLSVVTLLLSEGLATPSLEAAPPAAFGGPEIILFHGGVLGRIVPIATWDENQVLLVNGRQERISADTKFHLGARPRIELALFWGNWWRDVARDPARLATLTPAMAGQSGAFYPAAGSEPALIAVGAILGTLSDSGLAVLKRHGIPTSLEGTPRAH
ncbi:hypothetical protein BH11GEM1_BH11GEM1_24640 [soil metagenome]